MRIANGETKTIEILLEDLQEFFGKEDEKNMVAAFVTNTKRYISLFEEAIAKILPSRSIDPNPEDVLIWMNSVNQE